MDFRLQVTLIILALIALYIVLGYARVLIKQRKFMKNLKTLCKEQNITLSVEQTPYKSVFRQQKGYNFKVKKAEKTYYCKIIPGTFKRVSMSFIGTKYAIRQRVFKLIRVPLFHKLTKVSYAIDNVEQGASKILVILPPPKNIYKRDHAEKLTSSENDEVVGDRQLFAGYSVFGVSAYWGQANPHLVSVDNGEVIGDYQIFSGFGFLSALERDF